MGNRMEPVESTVRLGVKLAGLELANPMIAASGTFGWGFEFERIEGFHNADLGAIVLKGTTLKPRPGNANPRIVETAGGAGILNSIGLENPGVEKVVKEYVPKLRGLKPKVIANIAGAEAWEYAEVAKAFDGCDEIAAIEVNVSCPNVKQGGISFGCDPKACAGVVEGVRKNTKKPVIVKLTPNVTDIKVVARAAVDSGADILSLINTVVGVAIDVRTRKPILGNVAGGLSGPAVKPIGLAKVLEVHQMGMGTPMIGMGGISSAEDALEFMIVGARAFSVGTIMFRDHTTPARVLAELIDWCKQLGVKDINELVGTIKLK